MAKKIKKKRKPTLRAKPQMADPVEFETRFGTLVPWGGDVRDGGAFIRYDEDGDPQVSGEEEDDEDEPYRYN